MTLKSLDLTAPADAGLASHDPIDVLRQRIADRTTQAAFVRMADSLAQSAWHDSAVLLPPAQERVSLSRWLEPYRDHFAARLERLFRSEFPELFAYLRPRIIRQIAFDNVWPMAEASLRLFFLRALAAAWAHERIGDAVVAGQPRRDGGHWVVSLGLPGFGDSLGRVTLDDEGNVLPEVSSTKEEFLRIVKRAA